MSDYKAKIDAKDASIKELSRQVSNGYELRHGTCDVTYDFEKGIKTYIHNGVVVDKVKMTAADYQLTLSEEEAQK